MGLFNRVALYEYGARSRYCYEEEYLEIGD